jgi:hypothetical protein
MITDRQGNKIARLSRPTLARQDDEITGGRGPGLYALALYLEPAVWLWTRVEDMQADCGAFEIRQALIAADPDIEWAL